MSIRSASNSNLLAICLFFLCSIVINALKADELTVTTEDDTDISVERYAADGSYLVIWLSPEYGFRKAHSLFAENLAKLNIEVWQSNIVESLFLPQGSSSIKSLDGSYIAELIEHAHKLTKKKIILAGDSYGALAALKGAHAWQGRVDKKAIMLGAILFSPYTFAYIPPLGAPPEYMPVVSATNIPLLIYQAKDSGTIAQFKKLSKLLQQHENPVYIKKVPEVMSLFYKESPSENMLKYAKPLPGNIKKMLPLLEKHNVPAKPIAFTKLEKNKSGIDLYLKEFKGNNNPPLISLNDINGNKIIKKDYKGRVTVINFWATWCPPCIEEIPSLNRLNAQMDKNKFELISINYAEEKSEITEFMQQVKIDFPVLLDFNGEFSKQWNIVTYPSTFIIGKDGQIKYGVNAAIEWDNPELIEQLKSMMR